MCWAYSRVLIGRVTLQQGVGFLGKSQVVAVVHFNKNVANKNKGFKDEHEKFMNGLVDLCVHFKVQVLMGDFNMSFFQIVPLFRSRGKTINLAAWYPWKSEEKGPCADSCGIFMLTPSVCSLTVHLDHLHEEDATGILSKDALPGDLAHVDDPKEHPDRMYDHIPFDGGPGKELGCYLGKFDPLETKLMDSLTCATEESTAGRELERRKSLPSESQESRSRGGKHVALAVREKRLQATHWRYQGLNHKGSHFPVCCFTDNIGRRTDEARRRRNRETAEKKSERNALEQGSRIAAAVEAFRPRRTASVEAVRPPLRGHSGQSGRPSWPSPATASAAEWRHNRWNPGSGASGSNNTWWGSSGWSNTSPNVQPASVMPAAVAADTAAGPSASSWTEFQQIDYTNEGVVVGWRYTSEWGNPSHRR